MITKSVGDITVLYPINTVILPLNRGLRSTDNFQNLIICSSLHF